MSLLRMRRYVEVKYRVCLLERLMIETLFSGKRKICSITFKYKYRERNEGQDYESSKGAIWSLWPVVNM